MMTCVPGDIQLQWQEKVCELIGVTCFFFFAFIGHNKSSDPHLNHKNMSKNVT